MEVSQFWRERVLPELWSYPDHVGGGYEWVSRSSSEWRVKSTPDGIDPTRVVWSLRDGGAIPGFFRVHGDGNPLRCWLDVALGGDGTSPRTGKDFPESVRKVARLLNVDTSPIDDWKPPPEERRRHEMQRRARSVLAGLFEYGARQLMSDGAAHAREYLTGRGFPSFTDHKAVEALGLGYLPNVKSLSFELQKHGVELADANAFVARIKTSQKKTSWSGRILIGWRNAHGELEYVSARRVGDDDKTLAKYVHPSGARTLGDEAHETLTVRRPPLFGLDGATPDRDLVLVEGELDVLQLRALGFNEAAPVALAGLALSEDAMPTLERAGHITFALDNEEKGIGAAQEYARRLTPHGLGEFLWMIDPNAMEGVKDPGDLVKEYGVEAFRHAYRKGRYHAWRSVTEGILFGHDMTTEPGHSSAVRDVRLFLATIPEGQVVSMMKHIVEPLERHGIDAAHLQADVIAGRARLEAQEQRQRDERARKELQRNLERAQQHLTDGRVNDTLELMHSAVERARQTSTRRRDCLSLSARLDDFNAFLSTLRERDHIGLPQLTIPTLDKFTRGLRGLMIIGAPPGRGKTALGVQLAMDVVKNNTDACALVVSLEMSANTLQLRMLCRLADMSWTDVVHGTGKDGRRTWEKEELRRLEDANDAFARGVGRRIDIATGEDVSRVEDIFELIDALKRRTGCARVFVLVDYLQMWSGEDPGGRLRSDLDREKYQVEQMKRVRDHLDPGGMGVGGGVLVISETNKGSWENEAKSNMGALMGSARSAYSADCVMLIAPAEDGTLARYAGKDGDTKVGAVVREDLQSQGLTISTLQITKGRDGFTRGSIPLLFDFKQCSLTESSEAEFKKLCGGEQSQNNPDPEETPESKPASLADKMGGDF